MKNKLDFWIRIGWYVVIVAGIFYGITTGYIFLDLIWLIPFLPTLTLAFITPMSWLRKYTKLYTIFITILYIVTFYSTNWASPATEDIIEWIWVGGFTLHLILLKLNALQ